VKTARKECRGTGTARTAENLCENRCAAIQLYRKKQHARSPDMKFTLSKRILFITAFLLITGTAIAIFLLLGPPQLLARSESPDFCASCHVMEEQHTAWRHAGAHRSIRCVDCHLPNDNPARHYLWKSIDGMKDVIVFHSGTVPETITLSKHGQRTVQANCVSCHHEAVSAMDSTRTCWQCHRQTSHGFTGIIADNNHVSHQGENQ
jgi:cytochrome c nitrite reductase small subunit